MEKTREIHKSIILPAPIEEVWRRSFGTTEAFSTWFPEKLSGKMEVGATLTHVYENNTYEMHLTEIDPPRVLAYRWHPGERKPEYKYEDSEMTTVRITLQETDGGTQVTLIESGFERIPEHRRDSVFGDNTGGWDYAYKTLESNYQK